MIECNLCLERGVPAIKVLRSAFGLGLKEAKDIHDDIINAGGSKQIRCTFHQYGALIAYAEADASRPVWVNCVEIVKAFDGLDLTK